MSAGGMASDGGVPGAPVEVARQGADAAGAVTGAAEALADADSPVEAAKAATRWWGRHVQELRWQAELARLLVDPVYRGVGVPHGDGSPVLLVPGFLAGDETLRVLGGWLERIGYDGRRSGIHLNVDC